MEQKERSTEHIQILTEKLIHDLQNVPTAQIFHIEDILKDFIGRDLTLSDIDQAKNCLSTILIRNNYSPFHNGNQSQMIGSILSFVDGLRRYFVSDEMRKEIEKGIQFRNEAKRHKFEIYLECKDLRLLACKNYRKMIVRAFDIFKIDENLGNRDIIELLTKFGSQMRCEKCGIGRGKHRRPGLILQDQIKKLQE